MAGKARPEPQKASFQLTPAALTSSAPFPTVHTKAHHPSLTCLLSTQGHLELVPFLLAGRWELRHPPDVSYFCVPSQPGAGDVEVLPGRVQSRVFPDKAVLELPPHPAPGPLKVMVTMKRRGQGECRSQVQDCGGDGQTAPLRTVWKGM